MCEMYTPWFFVSVTNVIYLFGRETNDSVSELYFETNGLFLIHDRTFRGTAALLQVYDARNGLL